MKTSVKTLITMRPDKYKKFQELIITLDAKNHNEAFEEIVDILHNNMEVKSLDDIPK